MNVLDAGGGRVALLRFLPDSRRILVGRETADRSVAFSILTLPDGNCVDLPLPHLPFQSRYFYGYGPNVAIHPSGETCHIAWEGQLFAFRTDDGQSLPVPAGFTAHQVVISRDGQRLLAADLGSSEKIMLFAFENIGDRFQNLWTKPQEYRFANVAGFLPDGERFITIDHEPGVSIRRFADGEEEKSARYPAGSSRQPELSADGRYLGIMGYSSWYLYDTTDLGKPRRITANRSSGDYVSFAFHPGGKTFAMIHGGPTLVKIHDLETLKQIRTYKWKLGPLGAVAYSPDGALGAAGSGDGRIVVWDSDE
jgi:WD40 repeat protein